MRLPYRWRHLLRRKRVVAVILMVGAVFVTYQLLSVGQLSKELTKRKGRAKLHTNFREYEKADGIMQIKSENDDGQNVRHEALDLDSSKIKQDSAHLKSSQHILGVLPQNMKLYVPTSSGNFRCVHSGKEIPFVQLNDDFCDCDDFSDEPSTSACAEWRFFCSYQPQISNPTSIRSSVVNDGICDCCDGSDEWKNISLPSHTIISENEQHKVGTYQVPCKNRCSM